MIFSTHLPFNRRHWRRETSDEWKLFCRWNKFPNVSFPTTNISFRDIKEARMSRLWLASVSGGNCTIERTNERAEKKFESITCEKSWSLNTNKNHNKYWKGDGKTLNVERVSDGTSNCEAKIRSGGSARERDESESSHVRYWSQILKNYCNQTHCQPLERLQTHVWEGWALHPKNSENHSGILKHSAAWSSAATAAAVAERIEY